MKTKIFFFVFFVTLIACTLPINIIIPDNVPTTRNEVIDSLEWFAENAENLIPTATPSKIYDAYDEGLEIEFFSTTLPCDSEICPSGGANGLYYPGGRIELVWNYRLNDLRGTELIHELVHFLEDRVLTDCELRECNYPDNIHMQRYCEQHQCEYWERFDSILKYQYYLYITNK